MRFIMQMGAFGMPLIVLSVVVVVSAVLGFLGQISGIYNAMNTIARTAGVRGVRVQPDGSACRRSRFYLVPPRLGSRLHPSSRANRAWCVGTAPAPYVQV